jgi:hypothetical protein
MDHDMKNLKHAWLLGFLVCPLGACSGEVYIASTDGGTRGEENVEPEEGGLDSPSEVGQTDAGWDGWSGSYASQASGPAPECNSAPLACGAAFPGQSGFATSQEAANALQGQWSFCGDTDSGFYPPGQLGEEYAADGTYYELVAGSNGQLVRNMDPSAIGTWQVDLTPNGGIEVHTFGGGVQRGGGLSACPQSLVLLGVESRIP